MSGYCYSAAAIRGQLAFSISHINRLLAFLEDCLKSSFAILRYAPPAIAALLSERLVINGEKLLCNAAQHVIVPIQMMCRPFVHMTQRTSSVALLSTIYEQNLPLRLAKGQEIQ